MTGTASGKRILLRVIWVLLVFGALRYAGSYGGLVPYGDDWIHVEVLTGERPLSLKYLWEPDYAWRQPMPRLILFGLDRISGHDFRAPRFLSALLLGLAALVMIAAAGNARGRPSLTDTFFPLALLHWGHTRPLLQGSYLDYAMSVALVAAVLAVLVSGAGVASRRGAMLAGLSLICLPLCGVMGPVMVPFLALWLLNTGMVSWRRSGPEARTGATITLAAAGAGTALSAFYLVGYSEPVDTPPSPGAGATLTVACKFAAMSLGPAAKAFWPVSGLLVGLLLGFTFFQLVRHAYRNPDDRVRIVGLILFLGAVTALALAVGFGRSGYAEGRGEFAFESRYATLAVLLLCGIYCAWCVVGEERVRRAVQTGLLVTAAVLFPLNCRVGIGEGDARRIMEEAFLRDLDAGMAPRELAAYHWPAFTAHEGRMARRLELMREARFGPYAGR